jgi:predicted TIM-barrel fold metal-dependent hydrolase
VSPQSGIIDAHHHVWDLEVRDQDWLDKPTLTPLQRSFSLADLAPEAAAAEVVGTVLVQTMNVAAETPEFLALAAESTLVAGVVGWTDLTAPGVADALAGLRAQPGGDRLVGIRHLVQGEPDPQWLGRPDVRRGLAAVQAAGLAFDLVIRPHQLPAAVAAATELPGLTFVLDHLGKPPIAAGAQEPDTVEDWARDIRALALLPNTAAKLSGMVTEADWSQWTVADLRPYAETVIEAFGPQRVMFGSDWPVCLLAATYAEVVETAQSLTESLSPAERADVFSTTAARTYGLTLT